METEAPDAPRYRHDMTMFLTAHRALRRDLARMTRLAEAGRTGRLGWKTLKLFLDKIPGGKRAALFPLLDKKVSDSERAVLGHFDDGWERVSAKASAVDAALESGDGLAKAVRDLSDEAARTLDREEEHFLTLADRHLDEDEFLEVAGVYRGFIGPDIPVYLPWMLDGLDPEEAEAILGRVSEEARRSYEAEWRAAYERGK
ncbi:hypothetical protein [Salininema proteolyticum]|uniref:Hemerythrin HHE cation binding domain-containing protein n=1 Tax=Salininema proteolyticum TaxID=1607685 RepID=A0ABV8TT20_9ACTN